jgi:TolB protein
MRSIAPLPLALLLLLPACIDRPLDPRAGTGLEDPPGGTPLFSATAMGTETRITTDPANQAQPAIDGDRIVWTDLRNGSNDIYLYDLGTGMERQITSNPANQFDATISGDRIVWTDYRNGSVDDIDIYLYDLSTNTEMQITQGSVNQFGPDISGDRIVWTDTRNGFRENLDVYLYDLSSGTERQITTDLADQYNPAISGDRVVWVDWRNGSADLYLYDLSTDLESQLVSGISSDREDQITLDISGDRIVWTDFRHGNPEIYFYDLGTGSEARITSDPADQITPRISGDRVVWTDYRNGMADIYLYDLSTGTEMRITTDPRRQWQPDVSGDRIVWADLRDILVSEGDIYLFVVGNSAPAASAGGPYTGNEGAAITLHLSGSDPNAGDVLAYQWDLGDGTTGSGAAPPTSHTYADDGIYSITLIVSDGFVDSPPATTTATIANVAPGVAPFPGAEILVGETYGATGGFSDPGTVDTHTATVDYGDGSGAVPLPLAGYTFSLSKIYGSAGTFHVIVRVTDNAGDTGENSATVTVLAPAGGLANLADEVHALVLSGTLNAGQGNSLVRKLEAAEASLARGQAHVAIRQLEAFIAQVGGFVSGGQLTASEGAALTDYAMRLIAAILAST